MTEAERTAEDRRARRMAELDDGGPVSAGGLYAAVQNVPPPDVRGMTPEQEAVALERWTDAIIRWQSETAVSPLAELPPASARPASASADQVRVS